MSNTEPDAEDRGNALFETFQQAMSNTAADPAKGGFLDVLANMGENLEARVRSAVEEFRQLQIKWRRESLPLDVTIIPSADAAWTRSGQAGTSRV